MRPEIFPAQSIVELLRKRSVVTMAEMKTALGTQVDMTVFRKLRTIEYLSSYSHGGRFYTLVELAVFDAKGLWRHGEVRFSKFGSLIDTAEHFVLNAEAGVFAPELAAELGVEVKDPLLKLVGAGRIARQKLNGLYLYCAPDPVRRRQQILTRRTAIPEEPFGEVLRPSEEASQETQAAIILFLSTLNEKQRRLYAGLESIRRGRGSDQRIANWTGLDVHTVGRGRRELLKRDFELERIRKPGAGRISVEKKRPT
jgi:hypothetical protein